MISASLSWLSRLRFTLAYLAALAAMSIALAMLGPHVHEQVIRHASTNLHNLARGHVGTLVGSAFVVEAGPIYFWMPFLATLLILAELQLRTIKLMVAFFVGHIGATLVVVGALAAAVKLGWMPWSITRVSDVGMSYGALAVLGALTAAIPRAFRPAWIGWWVSVSVTAAIVGGEFTNAGHAVAVMLGVLISTRFHPPARWTPLRCVLLPNAAGFGFLILTHSWWGMGAAVVFGTLGASMAHALASRMRRPDPDDRNDTAETATNPLPAMSCSG